MALRGNHRHIIPREEEDEDMGTAVDLVRGGDLGGPPSTNALARGGNPEPARRGTQETAIDCRLVIPWTEIALRFLLLAM